MESGFLWIGVLHGLAQGGHHLWLSSHVDAKLGEGMGGPAVLRRLLGTLLSFSGYLELSSQAQDLRPRIGAAFFPAVGSAQ